MSEFAKLRESWDRLAQDDPFWAVLTCFGRGREAESEKFFAHGEREIGRTLNWVQGHVTVPTGSALDFGCGLGRLSQALATRFASVVGVDISEAMIERARSLDQHGVQYVLNYDAGLPVVGPFDFAISLITLQHIPPAAARSYLFEIVRVLAPRGVAVVQIPSHRIRGRLRQLAKTILPKLPWFRSPTFAMQMHGMRATWVRRTVERAGGRVIAMERDDLAGPAWISNRYIIVKD